MIHTENTKKLLFDMCKGFRVIKTSSAAARDQRPQTDATRKEKLDIPLVEEAKGQVQFFVLSVSGGPQVEFCLKAKPLPGA